MTFGFLSTSSSAAAAASSTSNSIMCCSHPPPLAFIPCGGGGGGVRNVSPVAIIPPHSSKKLRRNHHYFLSSSSFSKRRLMQRRVVTAPLPSSEYDNDDAGFLDEETYESEEEFLKRELAHLESLEDVMEDLENGDIMDDDEIEFLVVGGGGGGGDDDDIDIGNSSRNEDVEELLSLLKNDDDDEDLIEFTFGDDDDEEEYDDELLFGTDDDYDDDDDDDDEEEKAGDAKVEPADLFVASGLEQALLQGVVPATAGVGSECLPGDWGFDPLELATKDYIHQAQYLLLQSLPGSEQEPMPAERPAALILRDYREAEIRHGRLAMLAAMIWPLQEMLDRFILDTDQFGPLIYGPVTLPYFPLAMTLIMMLLGYLDIYAKAIKEAEDIGDAFLPGDCFWDPLQILQGAPATMKRNMQERELFNGRVAMLAFAAFTFEEATTHLPLIEIEGNELLFLPAYQVPYIQEWLDTQFG